MPLEEALQISSLAVRRQSSNRRSILNFNSHYAQALKLGDIELLRKMLIVSEAVLRAGKSAQQRGNE